MSSCREHRTLPMPLPEPVLDGALFRFPVVGLWAVGMAAAALGLARAAIDDVLGLAANQDAVRHVLEAVGAADLADRHLRGHGHVALRARPAGPRDRRMWDMVQAGTPVTAEQRGLLRIAATHATAASASVIDRMYTVAGGAAVFNSSPLQRCLRDVHAMTQHFFVAPPTYEMIGKVMLGVEPDGFLL